jgi:hypothetical protein
MKTIVLVLFSTLAFIFFLVEGAVRNTHCQNLSGISSGKKGDLQVSFSITYIYLDSSPN